MTLYGWRIPLVSDLFELRFFFNNRISLPAKIQYWVIQYWDILVFNSLNEIIRDFRKSYILYANSLFMEKNSRRSLPDDTFVKQLYLKISTVRFVKLSKKVYTRVSNVWIALLIISQEIERIHKLQYSNLIHIYNLYILTRKRIVTLQRLYIKNIKK